MKKVYEKPVVEVLEFDLQDSIMNTTENYDTGIGGELSGISGVEEW